MNFWCHIVQGTKLGVQVTTSITAFDRCCEAKVGNFEHVIVVEKKILWLEISVGNGCGVAVIEASHELLEVVSGLWLAECSSVSNEIEELATLSKLKNNERNLPGAARLFVGSRAIILLVDDVYMLKLLHISHFSHD